MTQIPGEPLGRLMQDLDGTCFSHSGIAVLPGGGDGPATHLASALAKDLPDAGLDLGGVRWDPFDLFWDKHRELYCIPMPDRHRSDALRYLARFHPEPGREGRFSYVKLIAVAAGLRSIDLLDSDPALADELFAAACRVGETWTATHHAPTYYCAELVASAYGRRFTRAEMVPPAAAGLDDDADEPEWFVRLLGLLDDEIDDVDRSRWSAWTDLLALLVRRDWPFLRRAISSSAQAGLFVLDDVEGPAALPEALGVVPPGHPGLARTDPVPHALVTPRMLWQAFGRETIRRVEREA
ncbi:hypothetical protein [Actinomycetospora straminea]|uniref:Uncharacterized protein n=1 Tax=Actinomycetospora straminea TaxID=663607 RepID=A0ABP9DZM2_9PSEU|nr:hypothetical protein [Actinomycetospora straminea]MDD7931039.1 hypothetical protein [Actinomycetospora straminea]